MLNVPAGLAFVLSAVSVFCAMRFPPCMKKPDKERSDNEVLTTDIRKPFSLSGDTIFYCFLFLSNIGCHGCQRGKSAAVSGLPGILPDNQTDNRLDNQAATGCYFCSSHSAGSPSCSISSVGTSSKPSMLLSGSLSFLIRSQPFWRRYGSGK